MKASHMHSARLLRPFTSLILILSIINSVAPGIAFAHEGHGGDNHDVLDPGGAPPAGSGPVDVEGFVRGIDGDTLETWIDGTQVGIGVIGIDVLEANTVCGAQAADFFQGMLYSGIHAEEDNALVFDDRLRRMYYLFTPEGDSIAHAMVQAGYARVTGEGQYAAELFALQQQARQDGTGCIWDAGGGDILPDAPLAPMALESHELLALSDGFQAQPVVSGLNFPTDFAFLPDGRMLVTEKSGLVRIAIDGSVLGTPFIDLRSQVNDYWDRGLLSVAVDPEFSSNSYVYFLFTYEHDDTDYSGPKTGRLIRVTATGNTANAASEVVVLGSQSGDSCDTMPVGADCIPSDGPGHSTGGLQFATDGTLFASLGEGANFNATTPQALRAQSLDSLGGKLVRITTGGQGLPDNPYWTGNAGDIRSKIWASGLRNAYRFTLRPGDGAPYIGDVGWVSWEEVNVAAAGANFGWPCYEGDFQQSAYSSEPVCQQLYTQGTMTPPIISYGHTSGGAAVTGGVFYNGTSYPTEYLGAYFYGDYARNFIQWALINSQHEVIDGPTSFDDAAGGPVAFKIGPDGDIYYLSISTGEIRHIVYTGEPSPSESGYVSDLEWASSTNGWGPVERDQSNGEKPVGDGGPLTINGESFAKGLGAHSPSEVVINLDGNCSQFTSSIGIDDEIEENGSVIFEVYSGSTLLASSDVLTSADDAQTISADLTDVTQLRLVVGDSGDNIYWDHADWADAWIECGGDQIPPTVVAMSPKNEAVDVPLSTDITATFSEPIDESTLTDNVSLLAEGNSVPSTVSYDASSNTLTIDPDDPLAASSTFNVQIVGGPGGVTDLAGNPLASDVNWNFATADSGGPAPTIITPQSTDTFIVGDEIIYSGSAMDGQGQPLPETALHWRVVIYHCNHIDCHSHQVLEESGASEGSFTVPDHGDQYYFDIELSATDAGLTNSTSVEVHPETVDVTLESSPEGLDVNLAGEQAAAPLTRPIVVGSVITVSVPASQGAYSFESWSDGGERVHTVEVGSSEITLTASYSTDDPAEVVYLSDLSPTSMSSHWGPVEFDQSNGEQAAGDGGPLTIGGVVYPKGLGVHAPSTIVYSISGCTLFRANIGVDDEVGANGTIVFEVRGDGEPLYQSAIVTGADSAVDITVDISNVETLELRVTDSGDNVYWDHADWADARIECGTTSPDATPPTVLNVSPTDGTTAVSVDSTVSATFSESIDETSLPGNFELATQGGAPAPATLTYDAVTNRVMLTPDNPLSPETVYVATISGGAGGIADLAGNELGASVNWTFTTAASTSGGGETFISDMVWASETNGWGPVERDSSNAEDTGGDGRPLTMGGVVFSKGLGAHAPSAVAVTLDGTCSLFQAIVGVDDEVNNSGSIDFEVWGDGVLLASRRGLTGFSAGEELSVDVTNVTSLRLVVTDAGDGIAYDHADWANARVACGDGPAPDTTPPTITDTNPADGAADVASNAVITVDFSENLDLNSLPGNVEVREQGTANIIPISVAFNASNNRLTVTPGSNLDPDSTFTVTITGAAGGVTDLNGNSLDADETWSFSTAPAPVGNEEYISDMTWVSQSNGWGPVERDQSNGDNGAGDGLPLTIGGMTFAKGIGAHSLSEIVVALDGACTSFAAMVGVDTEVGSNGSVVFQVFGDSSLLLTSPEMNGGEAPFSVSVDISGVAELRLVVTDAGDTIHYDHADWGDARVICSGAGDTTPPQVISQNPEADAVDVDPEAQVTVIFSEELDPATVAGRVTIAEQGASAAPASVNYSATERSITIAPDALLADDTVYVVTLGGGPTGITDLAGNALQSDVTWSFSTSSQVGTTPVFEAPVKYSAGTNAHGVSVVDVDTDGNLDLVVATTGDNAVVILQGDGDGGFTATGSYPTGVHPKFAATGDFNGDGDVDFASANQDDPNGDDVSVYIGSGNGSFSLAGHFGACSNPHEVASGDMDQDGNQDLAVVCWGSTDASLLLGNGDGSFQVATDLAIGVTSHSLVIADLDSDGNLDIVAANHDNNQVSVLLGNGDGTFAPRLSRTVGAGPHSIRTADLNQDGDLDLVTANAFGDSVTVLLGNGDGTFSRTDVGVGDEPKGVALGDIDGDGWIDIISANVHGTYPCCSGQTSISVLFNDQNGSFVGREDVAIVSSPFSVATGDFNEDGRLDVASANWHTNDVGIFLGNR